MIQLWIGLGLLTFLALAFIFYPFLQSRKLQTAELVDRSQENVGIFKGRLAELEAEKAQGNLSEAQFSELELELKKSLLEDAEPVQSNNQLFVEAKGKQLLVVVVLACLIPVSSFALYLQYGSPKELDIALNSPAPFKDGKQPSVNEAIEMLTSELEQRPENPEGWYVLATTYMNLGQFDKGAHTFEQVLKYLKPQDQQYVGVMGQYAQALYFAKEGKMDDEVRQQIQRTLDIDPQEVTALGLLGIDSFENGNYQQAINIWEKALVNAEGAAAESLRSGIQRAKAELVAEGKAPEPLVANRIEISLSVEDQYTSGFSADSSVFVFARPVGGRMPLAAVKLSLADLPAEIVLDDSSAMRADFALSTVSEVEVQARLSASSQPGAVSGDVETDVINVNFEKAENKKLELVLNRVVE